MSPPSLPTPSPNQTYITLSAIKGGYISLPERLFLSPADPEAKKAVPSLSFLITHPGPSTLNIPHNPNLAFSKGKPFHMLFDLGLRSKLESHTPPQQAHLQNRRPFDTSPGVADVLRAAPRAQPEDIALVLFSHVHWDHQGDPPDFPRAVFAVGAGTFDVLSGAFSSGAAPHQHFDVDLLPEGRKVELSTPSSDAAWKPVGPFPAALDLFGDGAVYVVDAPGHLPGHVNLLCRLDGDRWVYLGGDVAHDRRLLSGERAVGTWEGEAGEVVCIHVDKARAEESIGRVRELMGMDRVEVVIAHDAEWVDANPERLFPGTM